MKKGESRQKTPYLSVIVPVYKQEKTVVENVRQILAALEETQYSFEILPVVDGTSLDKSFQKLRKLRNPLIRPTGYTQNRGKGYAVRYGMKKARGEIITFIDGGMDIDPQGITMLLEHMKWYNADIIIGSKLHPASLVNYPVVRRIVTFIYYLLVKILFGLKVRDTQTGLKAYKSHILKKVLPRLLVKEFAFDIEILAVANHLGYKKIYDAPVKVDLDWSTSSIKVWGKNSAVLVLIDTLAIWYRLNILRYYDTKYRKTRTFDTVLNMFVNQP